MSGPSHASLHDLLPLIIRCVQTPQSALPVRSCSGPNQGCECVCAHVVCACVGEMNHVCERRDTVTLFSRDVQESRPASKQASTHIHT